MKTTRYFASSSVLLLLLLLSWTQPIEAQTLKLDMKLIMIPKGSNEVFVTSVFAGKSVRASGKGDAEVGCGKDVESETVQVEVEVGKHYWLEHRMSGGCVCTGTLTELAGISGCVSLLIGESYTNIAYDDDGACGVLAFSVWVLTNTAVIATDLPCGGLPADGASTTIARLQFSNLEPPIRWEIDPPALGCTIVASNNYAAIVRSGHTNGTIILRASGSNGVCYTRAPIDLIDPDEGSGCGSGCPTDKIGNGNVTLGSVDVRLSLGLSEDGKHGGWLQTSAGEPNADFYSPKSLLYRWTRPDVSVLRDAAGAIRQVKTPQGLADVITSNASLYAINFYRPTDFGPKGTNGFPLIGTPTPFAVWTFENPDPTTTNRLKVTESQLNQTPVVYEYRWLTNGWELNSASGLRVQTMTESWATNGGNSVFRTETTTTRQGTNAVVAQSSKTWRVDGQDEDLVERTWGIGSNARTNSYDYDANAYRQYKQIVRWDGSWDYYLYDSNRLMVTNFSSYLNQALTTDGSLCRMTIHDYSTNAVSGSGDAGTIDAYSPRLVSEYLVLTTSS